MKALGRLLLLGALWASPVWAAPNPELEAGQMDYEAERYDEAVVHLLRALKQEESPEIYDYLGRAYYNLGYFALAIEAFESALDSYGQTVPVELFLSLGFAYYSGNQLSQAQDFFNQVISSPAATPEYRRLAEQQLLITLRDQSEDYQSGLEAYRQGDYQRALQLFQQVQRIVPDSAEIYYYMGLSAYQLLDFELAKNYLQRVVELDTEGTYRESSAQTLAALEKLSDELQLRPLTGFVSLGTLGDSNVNYGGAGNNQVNQDARDNLAIQDLASTLNFNLNYALNPQSNLRYNYLGNFYWGLNNPAPPNLTAFDFNFQQHSLSLFHRIPLANWIELYIDSHGSLQFLGDSPFFAEVGLRPTLTLYETERLVTRSFIDVSTERYTEFVERDNWNYSLGLEQYIYLWSSRSWLRFNYRFAQVLANDALQSQSSTDGLRRFEFRAAASRSQNQLGLSLGFPVGPVKMELGTRFDFLNYNKPDVYREFRLGINPITGLPLDPVEVEDRTVVKFREDQRLTFFLTGEWPINDNFSLLGRYQRLTNVSNISPTEIQTRSNRSFLKDVVELSLRYSF